MTRTVKKVCPDADVHCYRHHINYNLCYLASCNIDREVRILIRSEDIDGIKTN